MEHLKQYFEAQATGFPGKVSYLYQDLKEPVRSFMCGKEEQVVSASTIKVPIMLCLFEKMQKESIDLRYKLLVKKCQILDDTTVFEYGEQEASLEELIVWMIENSDNTATNVLMEYIGFDEMNRFFEKMGLCKTKVERMMLDYEAIKYGKNNYISLQDFYQCMNYIYERKTEMLYGRGWKMLLHNRDHGDLMRYLYEEPMCAHKTGGLDGIEHDAGIFDTENGTYFLGVFLSEFEAGASMEKEAMQFIGRCSRKVFDLYK